MTNDPFGMQPQENDGKRLVFAVLLLTLIWMSYTSFFSTPIKKVDTAKESVKAEIIVKNFFNMICLVQRI